MASNVRPVYLALLMVLYLVAGNITLARGEDYQISWKTSRVVTEIQKGGVKNIALEFTSKVKIQDVEILASDEIKKYIIVKNSHFDSIYPNQSYSVSVSVIAACTDVSGAYEGTLRVRSKARTYSKPLAIGVVVSDAPLDSSSCVPNQVASGHVPIDTDTTIAVSDPTSVLYGAKVVIPKDAAIDPVDVVIGYEMNLPAPLNAEAQSMGAVQVSNVVIPHVAGGGPSTFNHVVQVTIPYDVTKAKGLPPAVVYWDEKNNIYRPVSVVSIDRINGFVTFRTSHFSRFVAIIVEALGASAPDVDTGFRMGVDSILHPNFTSYEFGGHCMAFASLATHYFSMNKQPKLFSFAQDGVLGQSLDDELVRSALRYTYALLSSKWQDVITEVNIPNKIDTGLLVLESMILTRQPVHFSIRSSSTNFGHSVVVYGYDKSNARFRIYDNNFPKEEVTYDWNLITGFGSYSKSGAYAGFSDDYVGFISDDTFGESAQFEKIIADWQNGTLKDYFAHLTVAGGGGTLQDLAFGTSVKIPVPLVNEFALKGHFNSPPNNNNAANYLWVIQNGIVKSVTVIPPSGDFVFNVDGTNASNTEVVLVVSGHPKDKFQGFVAFGKFSLTGQNFFLNFGFESGDFSSWTTYSYLRGYTGVTPLVKSYIVMPGYDPIAPDIPTVMLGNYAAKVNDSDSGYHATLLSQKARVPATGAATLKFYWAAVLEDPQHSPADQPYVDVIVRDADKSVELYRRRFYTADPQYLGWNNYDYNWSNWKAIPWQTVTISDLSQYAGDEVELTVEGADCALGGHGGYVYVDGEE